MGGSHNRSRVRRIITRVLVFLLLGALVNVAVAMAILVFEKATEFDDNGFGKVTDDSTILVMRAKTPFTTVIYVSQSAGAFQADAYSEWFHGDPLHLVPAWGIVGTPTPEFIRATQQHEHETILEDRMLVSTGWPFRSWWYLAEHRVAVQKTLALLYHTSRPPSLSGFTIQRFQRAVPTHVIWSGLLMNTLLYAAILWLLVVANPRLRQRSRVKHGLCPKCAYPVGESDVCTECGTLLPHHRGLDRR